MVQRCGCLGYGGMGAVGFGVLRRVAFGHKFQGVITSAGGIQEIEQDTAVGHVQAVPPAQQQQWRRARERSAAPATQHSTAEDAHSRARQSTQQSCRRQDRGLENCSSERQELPCSIQFLPDQQSQLLI